MIATVTWWLVMQLFGLAALPLAWRLLARLPSRGYPLAKALGLLLVAYLLWQGAILHLLPNDVGGIAIAFGAVAALSAWAGATGLRRDAGGRRPLLVWLRANLGLVIATELLFALILAAWAYFRAFNPEIAGTEKPMEFAFINGVLRSRFFPPQDPWLSGYAISYYYFGYVMIGVLIRLTGVDPAVGFNLGVALWYALVMIGAFGVTYDLVRMAASRKSDAGMAGERSHAPRDDDTSDATHSSTRAIGFGFLGALFVGFIGNLEGIVDAAYQRGLVPLSWIKWLDIKQLTDTPPTGNWSGGFWWWWRASRVIHDRDLMGGSVEVIDEFPFFSFLLGDLHPHVLALPFVLLAIGLALSIFLTARAWRPEAERNASDDAPAGAAAPSSFQPPTSNLQHLVSILRFPATSLTDLGWPGVILVAVILGALGFLNTWDFPIYVGLTAAAVGAGLGTARGLTRTVLGRAAGAGLLFGGLGWLLYLPFYLGFQSQLRGVLPNLLFPSRFSQFFVMFGLPLTSVGFLALVISRSITGRTLRRSILAALPWFVLTPLLLLALVVAALAFLPAGQAVVKQLLENPAARAAVGDGSVAQLWALVVRLRLANPWTFLVLALGLSWVVGLLGAILARPETDRLQAPGTAERLTHDGAVAKRLAPPAVDLFVLLMIGVALLLTFAVEFVYLRDLFGTRMNTVFKFYYQAWVLLALAAAYAVSRLASPETPIWLKAPGLALGVLLLAASLVYPALAIPSKAGDFRGVPTLDGLVYLRQAAPADVAAVEWIRANLPGAASVVEASGGSYSENGRISMSTGNPTLLGWEFHEQQWRGSAYDRLVAGRPDALDRIYRAARPEELRPLLEQWKVDFVFVGAQERRKYNLTDASLVRFDRALTKVYDRDGVRIYAR